MVNPLKPAELRYKCEGLTPASWSQDQREALWEHVLEFVPVTNTSAFIHLYGATLHLILKNF